MANVTWAKHAVFEAAVHELEWEARRARATTPLKLPGKQGCFSGAGFRRWLAGPEGGQGTPHV
jgi:hypothetical protein